MHPAARWAAAWLTYRLKQKLFALKKARGCAKAYQERLLNTQQALARLRSLAETGGLPQGLAARQLKEQRHQLVGLEIEAIGQLLARAEWLEVVGTHTLTLQKLARHEAPSNENTVDFCNGSTRIVAQLTKLNL